MSKLNWRLHDHVSPWRPPTWGTKASCLGVVTSCATDGSIHACPIPAKSYKSLTSFWATFNRLIRSSQLILTRLTWSCSAMTSTDATERLWLNRLAFFDKLVANRGVMVLNDPENLSHAINKTYFQQFPEEVVQKLASADVWTSSSGSSRNGTIESLINRPFRR